MNTDIELPVCPICGRKALVIHLFDTYDRADFGWTAGCGAARRADGVHGYKWEAKLPPEDYPSVKGRTKKEAIDKWFAFVAGYIDRHCVSDEEVDALLKRWAEEKELSV